MIVKKLWITKKFENPIKGYGGKEMVTRKWEGLFLFGFIPLWIENTSTEYS
jgi:hypothetical protein